MQEIKKLKSTIEEKEKIIKEKDDKISDQENQIKLLYNDNIQWEQKHNEKVKENENFKKWAMWDQDLVESFRKIEQLNAELNSTKIDLDKFSEENKKYKEENKILSEDLEKTKKSEEFLKKENGELKV